MPKTKLPGTIHRDKYLKKKTKTQPEYSVLLLLQHCIICGWVLFLLAFKWTQLSIISIFDLPWDGLLWFYEVSIHFIQQLKVEKVEKSKPLGKNKPYFHRHCPGECRDCLFFLIFFSLNPIHYFVEKMEPIFWYEYANLKNKNVQLFLSKHTATIIGKGQWARLGMLK